MPSIVDKDLNSGIIAQARLNSEQIVALGEVGPEHIDSNAIRLAQTSSQRIQSGFVAGNQHEVVASTGKAVRVGGADPGGGACDEDCGTSSHGCAPLLRYLMLGSAVARWTQQEPYETRTLK